MRLNRRNRGLALLVVVVALGNLLSRSPDREAEPAKPLLAGFDPARVETVRIEGPDGQAVLERTPDGWRVASRFGFPALDWVVEDLLARLGGVTTGQRVSVDPTARPRLGFDEGTPRVRCTGREGVMADLQVAAEPGGRGSYVALPGRPEVYRAPALAAVASDPLHYVDARLLHFDPAAVERVQIELPRAGVDARLERLEDGRWRTGSGRVLVPARVRPLVAWAEHLVLEDVVAPRPAPEHGLEDDPFARLRLEGADGGTTLVVGKTVPGGSGERFATVEEWTVPWVVTVSPETAARLESAGRALRE